MVSVLSPDLVSGMFETLPLRLSPPIDKLNRFKMNFIPTPDLFFLNFSTKVGLIVRFEQMIDNMTNVYN